MNFTNTISKKKLYKTKKNWYTATTIAGTIAGVMLFQSAYVTQVSADATDSSVVTPAQTPTASANPAASTNEKNVSSAEARNISQSSTDSTSNSSSKLSQTVNQAAPQLTNGTQENSLTNNELTSETKSSDNSQKENSNTNKYHYDADATLTDNSITPNYHLSPVQGAMNDVQTIWKDNEGVYHLYYLHNPNFRHGSDTSWQEATSTDLANWKNADGLAIADHAMDNSVPWGSVATGSMITSDGTIAGTNSGDKVAYFSSYGANNVSGDAQNSSNVHYGDQSIWAAVSKDNGQSFTPLKNQAIIANSENFPNFRDPQVIKLGDKWVMYTAEGDKIGTYNSTDGINWVYVGGTMMNNGAFKNHNGDFGMIECPVFEEVTADNGFVKDVMFFGGNDYADNQTTGTFYVIGHRDTNGVFTMESEVHRLDKGTDYYGANFGHFDDKLVSTAWLSNWGYAFPKIHGQNGQRIDKLGSMALVRDLKLKAGDNQNIDSYYFAVNPIIPETNSLLSGSIDLNQQNPNITLPSASVSELTFQSKDGSKLSGTHTITLKQDTNEVTFAVNFDNGEISMSRSSAILGENETYNRTFAAEQMGYSKGTSTATLKLILDTNSVELFNPDSQDSFSVMRYAFSNDKNTTATISKSGNAQLHYSISTPVVNSKNQNQNKDTSPEKPTPQPSTPSKNDGDELAKSNTDNSTHKDSGSQNHNEVPGPGSPVLPQKPIDHHEDSDKNDSTPQPSTPSKNDGNELPNEKNDNSTHKNNGSQSHDEVPSAGSSVVPQTQSNHHDAQKKDGSTLQPPKDVIEGEKEVHLSELRVEQHSSENHQAIQNINGSSVQLTSNMKNINSSTALPRTWKHEGNEKNIETISLSVFGCMLATGLFYSSRKK